MLDLLCRRIEGIDLRADIDVLRRKHVVNPSIAGGTDAVVTVVGKIEARVVDACQQAREFRRLPLRGAWIAARQHQAGYCEDHEWNDHARHAPASLGGTVRTVVLITVAPWLAAGDFRTTLIPALERLRRPALSLRLTGACALPQRRLNLAQGCARGQAAPSISFSIPERPRARKSCAGASSSPPKLGSVIVLGCPTSPTKFKSEATIYDISYSLTVIDGILNFKRRSGSNLVGYFSYFSIC